MGKKKLTLSKNNTTKKQIGSGSIRQSFSHGRSKTVTVEVKRRRGINKPNNKINIKKKFSLYTNKPTIITDEEWEKRLNVLKKANKLKAYEAEKAKEKSTA